LTKGQAGYVDEAFAFTGRYLDKDTGLQNNLNRWYDSDTGRWLSEDPIGFAAGDENLYRYVNNEPTNWTDPTGLQGGYDGVWDRVRGAASDFIDGFLDTTIGILDPRNLDPRPLFDKELWQKDLDNAKQMGGDSPGWLFQPVLRRKSEMLPPVDLAQVEEQRGAVVQRRPQSRRRKQQGERLRMTPRSTDCTANHRRTILGHRELAVQNHLAVMADLWGARAIIHCRHLHEINAVRRHDLLSRQRDGITMMLTPMRCASPQCGEEVAIRTYLIQRRKIARESVYCEGHGRGFLSKYHTMHIPGIGESKRLGLNVAFDLEMIVIDTTVSGICQFSLREIGGDRRLDCTIGAIEATTLQRELEPISTPRPLTHRAMLATITELGGSVENLVIDHCSYGEHEMWYEAKLHISQSNLEKVVDLRPSDGLVLAVISNAPIYVSNVVLDYIRS
jgi:RHS repeat-associated protein